LPNAGIRARYARRIKALTAFIVSRLNERALRGAHGGKTLKEISKDLKAELDPVTPILEQKAKEIAEEFVDSSSVASLNSLVGGLGKAGIGLSIAGVTAVGLRYAELAAQVAAESGARPRVLKWWLPEGQELSQVAQTRLAFTERGVKKVFAVTGRKSFDRLRDKFVAHNVGLIRKIPVIHHKRVEVLVAQSLRQGNTPDWLSARLHALGDITERRAELIATDQTNKIFEQMTRERVKSMGVKRAVWLHLGLGKTDRSTHIDMDGKVFNVEEGLYDSDVGRKVLPGELPFCYCSMRPLLDEAEGVSV